MSNIKWFLMMAFGSFSAFGMTNAAIAQTQLGPEPVCAKEMHSTTNEVESLKRDAEIIEANPNGNGFTVHYNGKAVARFTQIISPTCNINTLNTLWSYLGPFPLWNQSTGRAEPLVVFSYMHAYAFEGGEFVIVDRDGRLVWLWTGFIPAPDGKTIAVGGIHHMHGHTPKAFLLDWTSPEHKTSYYLPYGCDLDNWINKDKLAIVCEHKMNSPLYYGVVTRQKNGAWVFDELGQAKERKNWSEKGRYYLGKPIKGAIHRLILTASNYDNKPHLFSFVDPENADKAIGYERLLP